MTKPTLETSRSLSTFAVALLSVLVCAPAYPLDFDPYGDGAKQADREMKAKETERQLKAARQEAAEARKRLADLERQLKGEGGGKEIRAGKAICTSACSSCQHGGIFRDSLPAFSFPRQA